MKKKIAYLNFLFVFVIGQEVLSGSQRVHDDGMLMRRIKECGLNEKSFTFFRESFRYVAFLVLLYIMY
jgi:aspartyl-tRNA synthetase